MEEIKEDEDPVVFVVCCLGEGVGGATKANGLGLLVVDGDGDGFDEEFDTLEVEEIEVALVFAATDEDGGATNAKGLGEVPGDDLLPATGDFDAEGATKANGLPLAAVLRVDFGCCCCCCCDFIKRRLVF